MHFATALALSWMNILTKKRYDALVRTFGSMDAALPQIDVPLLQELGMREEVIFSALNRLEEFDADAYADALAKRSILFLTIEDEGYPPALLRIPDPPIFLYYKGSIDILNQPCIACVGRREMSPYGKRIVEHIVPRLVEAGMVTVSGLAKGIDTEVAKETLHAGGSTVAIVGHGLADIYPAANRGLAEEIVEGGGLILSEFPLDMQADKYTFPARNRLIAALSLGTVVLEAGEGSGACITAELALDYGKDVFAVPGQIFDEGRIGCHSLIANGQARLITSAEDILQEIGVVAPRTEKGRSAYCSEDAEEMTIYAALTGMPQSASDLVEKTRLDTAILNAKLTMLELHGAARNIGNGMWVRQ